MRNIRKGQLVFCQIRPISFYTPNDTFLLYRSFAAQQKRKFDIYYNKRSA